jgi:hypothetical protein
MRSPSLALFFVLVIRASAQDIPYIDSLWQVYRAPGTEAHERLLTLHAIADETRYDDPDSARTLAEDLMRQGIAQQDTIAMALAHRDFGSVAEAGRDNAAALRHYQDAIALFPGGFGTMDEGYEALTLMQTGKSQLMPLVLVDRPGGTYWKTWDKHVREHLLRDQLISPDDLNLYHITDDANEAVSRAESIRRFHVLDTDFTEQAGYLTPSLKLRRNVVTKDFADQIDALYS